MDEWDKYITGSLSQAKQIEEMLRISDPAVKIVKQIQQAEEIYRRHKAIAPPTLAEIRTDAYADEIRRLNEQFERIKIEYGAVAAASERKYEQLMRASLNEQLMRASLMPFPDLKSLVDIPGAQEIESVFGRLSGAVARSKFIARVEFEPEPEEVEEPQSGNPSLGSAESSSPERVGKQLVQQVPADTLYSLKQVDFVPLTLLDRVLRDPEAMRSLSARDFERFIATLIDRLGFEDVILTPSSGDDGRDIIATKRVHGISIIFAFECKRYAPNNPVGPEIARALLGTITSASTRATAGVLVTTSYFSPATRKLILTEPALDGRDFQGIVEWLHEYSLRRHPSDR